MFANSVYFRKGTVLSCYLFSFLQIVLILINGANGHPFLHFVFHPQPCSSTFLRASDAFTGIKALMISSLKRDVITLTIGNIIADNAVVA